MKLVNQQTKKYHVIVVGTGLAGAFSSSLYSWTWISVSSYCFLRTVKTKPIQVLLKGGINAAKIIKTNGDNIHRLFGLTVKVVTIVHESQCLQGLQLSVNIIRSVCSQVFHLQELYGPFGQSFIWWCTDFKGFMQKDQQIQQLFTRICLSKALSRQIHAGKVNMSLKTEMLDLIVDWWKSAWHYYIRDLTTGKTSSPYMADAVVACNRWVMVTCFVTPANAMG